MLKRIVLGFVVMWFGMAAIHAQKVAVLDIASILETMDEYKQAQKMLDEQSATWRQEINAEMDKVKGMYNKYQAELPLLNDEMKVKREEEITVKEQSVRDLQRKRFGADGDLFKKREELVRPIQDKVYKAIDDFAKEKAYDLILDKSSAAGILFAGENIDKTEEVRKRIK